MDKKYIIIGVVALLIIAAIGYYYYYYYSATSSTASTGSSSSGTSSSTTSPVYMGCYIDGNDRDLPVYLGNFNSVDACLSAAKAQNYKYAGIQYGGECRAGNSFSSKYGSTSNKDCAFACDGGNGTGAATSETNGPFCGSGYKQSIYRLA